MSTFMDTSAIYELLDAGDVNHQRAANAFGQLRDTEVLTHA
jgi:predicted nucleic acid-binding protein